MPNNIYHKRNANPGVAPTAAQLAVGEIALNTADGKAYTRKADGTVVELTEASVADGGEQFTPLDVSNLALWLDASDTSTLYTTDAGPVTAVTASNLTTEISGVALWYDGSDASTLFDATSGGASVAPGGTVARWQDKSGNARHLVQATSTLRPTRQVAGRNGLDVVTFDATDDFMGSSASLTLNQALTYIIVYKTPSSLASSWSLFDSVTDRVHAYSSSGADLRMFSGGLQFVVETGMAPDQWRLSTFYFNGASSSGRLSGAQLATGTVGTNAASGTFNLGANNGGAATIRSSIAEVIVLSGVTSFATIARVEAYLAAKWGISNVHTQATTTAAPVGYWRDKSGNGRHPTQITAASRASVALMSAGKNGVAFNGSASTLAFLQGIPSNNITVFCAFVVDALNGGIVYDMGYTGDQTNSTTSNLLGFQNQCGMQVTLSGGVVSAQDSNRPGASNQGGVSGGLVTTGTPYVQTAYPSFGTQPVRAASINGGAQGFNPVARYNGGFWSVISLSGRRNSLTDIQSTSVFFNGKIGEFIVYSQTLTAAQRQKVEAYLAAKWGATFLAPQVSNLDAQNWINRVYQAGGSVSQSTAAAVNTFCNAIDAAGIRDRFYRLNLFCGNDLTACLVPLYRSWAYTSGKNLVQGDVFTDWTQNNATLTAAAAVPPSIAPVNGPQAASLLETTTGSAVAHFMSYPIHGNGVTSGGTLTVSAYLKPNGRDWALVSVEDAGGTLLGSYYFNVAGLSAGGGVSSTNPVITDAGNGWARVSFSCTPAGTVTANSRYVRIYTTTANNSNVTIGDSTKGLFVWGVQVEYSTSVTAYETTQLGSATDVNTNFTSSDYTERGSLAGLRNGSGKYLSTSLPMTFLGTNQLHLFASFMPIADLITILMGARTNVSGSVSLESFYTPTSTNINRQRAAIFSPGIQPTGNATVVPGRTQLLTQIQTSNTAQNFVRNVDVGNTTLGAYSSTYTTPFYILGGDANGSIYTVGTSLRLETYSIGAAFTTDAGRTAFHNALIAFQNTLGRNQ